MAKFFSELSDSHRQFIAQQNMFFTASAPSHGRINLSPKGMDTFRILDNNHVAYLDLTGSGNETSAHIQENNRLTFMFCSFQGAPLILRLYGKGEVVPINSQAWHLLTPLFPVLSGQRQIIKMRIESVQSSCGYSIPLYEYLGERDTLVNWAQKKGAEGIKQYWEEKNTTSIDGANISIPTRENK